MVNISNVGRVFYGIAIAEIGLQTIYERDFPYMLLPPNHSLLPGLSIFAYVFGLLFVLAGIGIIFEKKTREISLLLAGVLLLIFCLYYVPYQFITGTNYRHLGDWGNAEKELAFAGGALVIAGCFPGKNENSLFRVLGKLISFGAILFSITIISFGILHFLVAKEAATLVPSWIPYHLFWIYFAGVALIGSGVTIILKIMPRLTATLLGIMIFLWFILLHIPRVVVSPAADLGGEVTSAILALAYSGIAFVIAGASKAKDA